MVGVYAGGFGLARGYVGGYEVRYDNLFYVLTANTDAESEDNPSIIPRRHITLHRSANSDSTDFAMIQPKLLD